MCLCDGFSSREHPAMARSERRVRKNHTRNWANSSWAVCKGFFAGFSSVFSIYFFSLVFQTIVGGYNHFSFPRKTSPIVKQEVSRKRTPTVRDGGKSTPTVREMCLRQNHDAHAEEVGQCEQQIRIKLTYTSVEIQ